MLRVLDGLTKEQIETELKHEWNPDHFVLWKARPNGEEDPFGYKGRVCIMEQLSVTEDIQKFIRGDVEDVNTDLIEKTAKGLGMITLEQKGVLAALRGDTTLEEIGRVI